MKGMCWQRVCTIVTIQVQHHQYCNFLGHVMPGKSCNCQVSRNSPFRKLTALKHLSSVGRFSLWILSSWVQSKFNALFLLQFFHHQLEKTTIDFQRTQQVRTHTCWSRVSKLPQIYMWFCAGNFDMMRGPGPAAAPSTVGYPHPSPAAEEPRSIFGTRALGQPAQFPAWCCCAWRAANSALGRLKNSPHKDSFINTLAGFSHPHPASLLLAFLDFFPFFPLFCVPVLGWD